MILNGQHSVNCFRYAPLGMHSKINSVPDPSREACRLDVFVDKSTRMVMFLLLSCDILGNELPWNCIIEHHKDNYHKVVPFILIHIVLFIRIMRDCAEICELCDRMRFLINYAESYHRTLTEALFCSCNLNLDSWSVGCLGLFCQLNGKPEIRFLVQYAVPTFTRTGIKTQAYSKLI